MQASVVIGLMLEAATAAAEYAALIQKMQAEGRTDLTPDEVEAVRAKTQAAIDALKAAA